MSEADTDDRKILSPFDKRECISLKQAADIAGKSESTLRTWCEERGLGRRIGGGTWSVSKVALAMFLDGDQRALRAYHSGDRTSELVAGYFERTGLGTRVAAKVRVLASRPDPTALANQERSQHQQCSQHQQPCCSDYSTTLP
jgi:hypothetical protein